MKLNRTLLSIICTAIIVLLFFTAYFAIYAVNHIEQKQLKTIQLSLYSNAEVAMRISHYQNQKVRFEDKQVDKAQIDSLRLIKEMLNKRKDIALQMWIGKKVSTDIDLSDQILYSSIPPQEIKRLRQKIGDFSQLTLEDAPVVFRDYVVFPLKEWGWYGIIVADMLVFEQELAQQSTQLYLFFLFFALVVIGTLLGIIFYTLANYQKVELGYEQERFLFKSSPDFLILYNNEGRVIDVSDALLDKMRMRADEVLQRSASDLPWWNHGSNSLQKMENAYGVCLTRQVVNFFAQHPTITGDNLQIHHRIMPLLDEHEQVRYILDWGVDSDFFGERLKHRDELTTCASYFFENSTEAFIVHGIQRGIIVANMAAQQLFKVKDLGELIGNNLADLSPLQQSGGEDSSAHLVEAFSFAMAKGSHQVDWSIRNYEGKELKVNLMLMRGVLGPEQVLYISLVAQAMSDGEKRY